MENTAKILQRQSTDWGMVLIDLKRYLHLPFFYVNPECEYGTWLPAHLELQTAFPVFVAD